MTLQNRSLISRFSSSIVGGGKKISGHKIFINSLFLLRNNNEKKVLTLYLQKEMFEKRRDNDLFIFLLSFGFSPKVVQSFLKYLQNSVLKESEKFSYDFQDNVAIQKREDIEVEHKDFFNKKKETINIKNPTFLKASALKKPSFPKDLIKNKKIHRCVAEPSIFTKSFKGLSLHEIKFLKTFFAQSKMSNTEKQNDHKEYENFDFLTGEKYKIDESKMGFTNRLICSTSRDNVKPILENRKVRKGRVTYKVPLVTQPERQEGKAIAWLVESASSRKNKTKHLQSLENRGYHSSLLLKILNDKKKMFRSFQHCLADELLDSYKGKGDSVDKKNELHKIALQNRAYTHYRWW